MLTKPKLLFAASLAMLLAAACSSPTPTTNPNESALTQSALTPITQPTNSAAPTVDTSSQYENLHVPSPEWQDQIIYFLMTDRFNDGDPTNNDQGGGEYDPTSEAKYSGGDMAGIMEQLDYIQGLGATAIWITPPVANQWWDPLVNYGGYHGYWAQNFMEVDAHLGTLDTYQMLSNTLHSRGMYLIQDVVVNHTGNFFYYENNAYSPSGPERNFMLNTESTPVERPSQHPFDFNDINDRASRDAAIYHWTPSIRSFDNDEQALTYQLFDLDDLNTENPAVRQALRQSYDFWVRNVGVDGFRVDTILYVEPELWNDFFFSNDPNVPGIDIAAAQVGAENFYAFGEAFVPSPAFTTTGTEHVASFIGTANNPGLDAVINFPLYYDINRVFAAGQGTKVLAYRLNLDQETYPDPNLIPTFIDNHDVARFRDTGSAEGLKQALMFQLTAPGIPVIYYGTEQEFSEQRAAMFAEGYGSGGEDHFNTESDMYQHIAALTAIRKANLVFSRGSLEVLASSDIAGVLAYQREYEGQTAIVLFNTSDKPVLASNLETGLPTGTVLDNAYSLFATDEVVVGPDGKLTLELAAHEGMILLATDETASADVIPTLSIDVSPADQTITADFTVSGNVSEPGTPLKVIVNGNLARTIDGVAGDDGSWSITVPITSFRTGDRTNRLQVYAPELGLVSDEISFKTSIESNELTATVADPEGDDTGPSGAYTPPTDSTFSGQMDILEATVTASSSVRIALKMRDVTDVWGPANGFDHVLFHIFFDIPGIDGASVLPNLNADAPQGFAWDYMTFVEGWNNRHYSSAGSSDTEYGTSASPSPEISVDVLNNIITLIYSPEALGDLQNFTGLKVYIATWDWDGVGAKYRPLTPSGSQWEFGGGDGTTDPLIFDQTDVIELK